MINENSTQIGNDSYKIVNARPEHLNMILAQWMRSLRHGNNYFKLIKPSAFYQAYNIFIRQVLSHPDVLVQIAVLSDDSDVVLGWCISNKTVLHYIHVQKLLRRQGIAKTILPNNITEFTNLTQTGITLWNDKVPHWVFNPFQ